MDKRYDLICMGTALVDCLVRGLGPEPASLSGRTAASCSLETGGEAVNAAAAGAKLGLRTGIVCALGRDEAGGIVRRALERNGVEAVFIAESPSTPVSVLFIAPDGGRTSVTNAAHRYNFRPDGFPEAFTCARILILGSLLRAPFDDPGVILSVLKAAGAAGQTVIADTKLPNFRHLTLDDIRDSLPLIDYLTPNEDEARYLTGKADPEAAADVLLGNGARCVIVKLGAGGCLMKTGDGLLRLPGYAVRALDATGAGDNFAAGFASELLRGGSRADALRFANACGAVCTLSVGAGTALKNREQVLRFMETTPFGQ